MKSLRSWIEVLERLAATASEREAIHRLLVELGPEELRLLRLVAVELRRQRGTRLPIERPRAPRIGIVELLERLPLRRPSTSSKENEP